MCLIPSITNKNQLIFPCSLLAVAFYGSKAIYQVHHQVKPMTLIKEQAYVRLINV